MQGTVSDVNKCGTQVIFAETGFYIFTTECSRRIDERYIKRQTQYILRWLDIGRLTVSVSESPVENLVSQCWGNIGLGGKHLGMAEMQIQFVKELIQFKFVLAKSVVDGLTLFRRKSARRKLNMEITVLCRIRECFLLH